MSHENNHSMDETGEFDDLLSRYREKKSQSGAKEKSELESACGETRLIGEPIRPGKRTAAPGKAPVEPHAEIRIGLPLTGSDEDAPAEVRETAETTREELPISDMAATHFLENTPTTEEEAVLASHVSETTGNEPPVPTEEPGEEDEEDEEPDPYEGMSLPKKIFCKIGNAFLHMSFLAKALIYMAAVVIVAAYLSYFVIEVGNDVFAFVTGNEDVLVTIPEDASEEEVTGILRDRGLIDYEWSFKLFLQYYGKGEKVDFIPGDHTLNMSMNYSQMINALTTVRRQRVIVTLTFPEGFTVDDVINLFLQNGIGTREGFVEAINHYPYKHDFVRLLDTNGWPKDRVYRLEGYLYPDTYDFYTDTDEYLCINKLLNNFNDKVWLDWKSDYAAVAEKYGMSLDETITLASLIESEGRTAEDFEYISQVFHNRLSHAKDFPRLESDATIQYAMELAGLEREKDPSKINLSFPSPFNTYLYDGLTPGAICNPGLDAILAAIYPSKPLDSNDKEIDAYFFVSNNAGKTYYAATKAAHERNKQTVAKENAAMEKEAEQND